MIPNNVCPDCKSVFKKPIVRCLCGWLRSDPVKPVLSDFACKFSEYGQRCQKLGSVSISVRSQEWYCGEHAERLRDLSYKFK